MDNVPLQQLHYLGLIHLAESWNAVMTKANRSQPSYHRFLTEIVEKEYESKTEKARRARIKRAKLPEIFVMETFPLTMMHTSGQGSVAREMDYKPEDAVGDAVKRYGWDPIDTETPIDIDAAPFTRIKTSAYKRAVSKFNEGDGFGIPLKNKK